MARAETVGGYPHTCRVGANDEPLLTAAQAGMHLLIPRSTISEWAASGLLHAGRSGRRFEPTMPLLAVAEAQVLRGLKGWGLHSTEIRRAARLLHQEFGPFGVLTQRLATDGAALLRDLAEPGEPPRWERVADRQAVLPSVVDDHVQLLEWGDDGHPQRLLLRSYAAYGAEVVLDPRFGYGQPVFGRTKVRAIDVARQCAAGEDPRNVAEDYGLRLAEVRAVLRVLGRRRLVA